MGRGGNVAKKIIVVVKKRLTGEYRQYVCTPKEICSIDSYQNYFGGTVIEIREVK